MNDHRTPALISRMSRVGQAITAAIVLAVIAALGVAFWPSQSQRHLTVEFSRTVSLYTGSDVRILGVKVGQVDSITPMGTHVQVKLSYDAKYKVPADAKAVVISPAIVGDRYVQLTPAYTGGPVMADNATVSLHRTAVPVELDQIYQSLDDLSVALGPKGANKSRSGKPGALSRLVNVSAANLGGRGAEINQTIHDLSLLTGTLSDNKTALFGSLRQVQTFVHALAANDGAVRRFNSSLAGVSTVLAGQRHDLAASLHALGGALTDVESFVKQNKGVLRRNIHGLVGVTQVLVKQRAALTETLRNAPLALTNLAAAYNSTTGTLDNRDNIGENVNQLGNDPRVFLCALLNQAGNPGHACQTIGGLLHKLPKLPPISGLPRSAPFPHGGRASHVQVEHVDTTLAGLLAVNR
ncbi:MAG: MCE family protein [Nocardioidaceae bacterium]